MLNEIAKVFPSLSVMKKFPESGQKEVFLVETKEYGRTVLKIVKEMNERIKREIDILCNANIIGTPKVLFYSSIENNEKNFFYFFEEYIEGESLKTRLSGGPLSLCESINLFDDLLTIVECLEREGIVHRDIKPDNIICGIDGSYKLIDFGIARNLNLSTITFAAVGPHTPGYAAPELFMYDKTKIDSRADLFSIGVVVYESIFGKHPFITGKEIDAYEIWYKTITITPENHTIPGDTDRQLIGLLETMMKKQVTSRPPTAKRAHEWFRAMIDTLKI